VSAAQSLPPKDPEFDGPARPALPLPPRGVIAYYQRVIVNPFLGLLLGIATPLVVGALRRAYLQSFVPFAVGVELVLAYAFLQYHCLDCGATGMYHRWNRHACPRVVERWLTPYSSASRFFPTPPTQLVLWFIGLLIAGAVLAVSLPRR
jgi:hypothetical protein